MALVLNLPQKLQKKNGYSYYQQFDAIPMAADRLIHMARREAE